MAEVQVAPVTCVRHKAPTRRVDALETRRSTVRALNLQAISRRLLQRLGWRDGIAALLLLLVLLLRRLLLRGHAAPPALAAVFVAAHAQRVALALRRRRRRLLLRRRRRLLLLLQRLLRLLVVSRRRRHRRRRRPPTMQPALARARDGACQPVEREVVAAKVLARRGCEELARVAVDALDTKLQLRVDLNREGLDRRADVHACERMRVRRRARVGFCALKPSDLSKASCVWCKILPCLSAKVRIPCSPADTV